MSISVEALARREIGATGAALTRIENRLKGYLSGSTTVLPTRCSTSNNSRSLSMNRYPTSSSILHRESLCNGHTPFPMSYKHPLGSYINYGGNTNERMRSHFAHYYRHNLFTHSRPRQATYLTDMTLHNSSTNPENRRQILRDRVRAKLTVGVGLEGNNSKVATNYLGNGLGMKVQAGFERKEPKFSGARIDFAKRFLDKAPQGETSLEKVRDLVRARLSQSRSRRADSQNNTLLNTSIATSVDEKMSLRSTKSREEVERGSIETTFSFQPKNKYKTTREAVNEIHGSSAKRASVPKVQLGDILHIRGHSRRSQSSNKENNKANDTQKATVRGQKKKGKASDITPVLTKKSKRS